MIIPAVSITYGQSLYFQGKGLSTTFWLLGAQHPKEADA
jgi:hypothetical protein